VDFFFFLVSFIQCHLAGLVGQVEGEQKLSSESKLLGTEDIVRQRQIREMREDGDLRQPRMGAQ
jgi:hypothetical protein